MLLISGGRFAKSSHVIKGHVDDDLRGGRRRIDAGQDRGGEDEFPVHSISPKTLIQLFGHFRGLQAAHDGARLVIVGAPASSRCRHFGEKASRLIFDAGHFSG